MESLGYRIRELRLRRGITQIELSKGIITPSMVSQIESDRARPSFKVLVAIADRLGVPLEDLLKGVNIDLEYTSKYKMALSMVRAGEFETAILLLEELLESETHRISKEKLLLELALCHLETGDVVRAEGELNQLVRLLSNGENERMLAVALLHLGKAASLKSDLPIALFHTNRAWDELQKMEEIDAELHGKVLMQLAILHEKVGKVAEAATYYEKALRLNQCSNEERGRTYLRLAEVYGRQKKYEQAEEYASKAALLLEEQSNRKLKLEMQHRMVMLQRGTSDWRWCVQKLLSIAKQCEQDREDAKTGDIYADIALICLENQEFDEACTYAEKASLSIAESDPVMGKVHRVMSFVALHRKDEQQGEEHFHTAVRIFEQHGNVAELEEVTLVMCRYLSDNGEYREAFERMERLHHYVIRQFEQRGIVL